MPVRSTRPRPAREGASEAVEVRADGESTVRGMTTSLVGERVRLLRYQGPEQRSREGAHAGDLFARSRVSR